MSYNINKLREMLKKNADYLQTGDASKRANMNGARLPINIDLAEDPND